MHYLKSVQNANNQDADVVMKQLKALPVNDFMTVNGTIRADGRVLRDMYLFQVKAPKESTQDWDFYNLVTSIPAESAFRPLSQGACVF